MEVTTIGTQHLVPASRKRVLVLPPTTDALQVIHSIQLLANVLPQQAVPSLQGGVVQLTTGTSKLVLVCPCLPQPAPIVHLQPPDVPQVTPGTRLNADVNRQVPVRIPALDPVPAAQAQLLTTAFPHRQDVQQTITGTYHLVPVNTIRQPVHSAHPRETVAALTNTGTLILVTAVIINPQIQPPAALPLTVVPKITIGTSPIVPADQTRQQVFAWNPLRVAGLVGIGTKIHVPADPHQIAPTITRQRLLLTAKTRHTTDLPMSLPKDLFVSNQIWKMTSSKNSGT